MPGRDDFNSSMGRPGGFGGSMANGGVGGGMGGGNPGGGYGGGMTQNTGLRTGATMQGTSAFGRPGGMAQGYGMNPAQARQAAMQGIMGRLMQGQPQPTGAQPPQTITPAMSGLHPSMWMNNPTQRPYDPATSPVGMMQPHVMPNYPKPPLSMNTPGAMVSNFPSQQVLAPGQPKYQDRVPSGVGAGNWAGQASDPRAISGQNWGNPGAGSMGLGSSGGGRAGGGGRGW
jgi:hypothetical protein